MSLLVGWYNSTNTVLVIAHKISITTSNPLKLSTALPACRSNGNSSNKTGVSVSTTSPPSVKANSAAAAAQPPADDDADPLLRSLSAEAADDDVQTGKAGWAATLGVVGGIAILLGGGYIFKDAIKHFLDFFIQAVDDWGVWGYVAYAVVYAGLEVLAVPAIPLTMTAGVIFGPLPGTVIVSISATVAATIAFLIARYAARDKVSYGLHVVHALHWVL